MRTAAAVSLLAVLAVGVADAATRCPPATYGPLISRTDGLPLAGGSSPSGAFVIGTDTITMGACGTTALRVRARRHLTLLLAVWQSCPGFGRVRYQGGTNYPPCFALVSTLRWRDRQTQRARALKFESLRAD
jgi:hypothetical protein